MPLIWTVPEQPSSHKKMRLAAFPPVSNSQRLKHQYVGVTTDSALRPFLPFSFYPPNQPLSFNYSNPPSPPTPPSPKIIYKHKPEAEVKIQEEDIKELWRLISIVGIVFLYGFVNNK